MKTNALRILESAEIDFEVRTYQLDEEQFSAEAVATEIGMAPETVFKTLIAMGDTSPLFALIPANTELNLRALAATSGNKRVSLVPLRDVLDLTGYRRGAVTVLAARRSYPAYIDETVVLWPIVAISGGEPGLQLLLRPQDLLQITGAQLADIAG